MKPRLSAWTLGAAVVLIMAVPAAARPQRHAPAGPESQPAAVPRSAPAPAPAPTPAPAPSPAPSSSAGRDSGRGQERASSATSRGSDASDDNGSTAAGRRRGNLPKTGDAAKRTSPPRPPDTEHGGGGHGNGGVIAGGYPWWSSGFYGGAYAYDPGLGWYPSYDATSGSDDEGALRLKVKPVEASVYVDGYFVGIVDEFDGVFQRLRLEPGPHHLEIRLPEYDDLSIDVMIQPDQTTTYRGVMELRTQK